LNRLWKIWLNLTHWARDRQEQVRPEVSWEEPRRKVPITMGRPKFNRKSAPFYSTITTPSDTPILDRPHSPCQTSSGSTQPFCHNTLCGQTNRQTDRPTDMFRHISRLRSP